MRKRVHFIANSLDNAYKFQHVLLELDAEVAAGSTVQIKRLLSPDTNPDLVIFEAQETAQPYLDEVMSFVELRGCSLLVIADEETVEWLDFPTHVPCDFVMFDAGHTECLVRTSRLLGIADASERSEVIRIDNMVINLATYQVTVADEPVDFTYLEYTLLAFLVQHPDHTHSRDALLQSVWGIDYYGSSRTVDVHVRRVRAKLGPYLARHLETTRGVGYLWNSH